MSQPVRPNLDKNGEGDQPNTAARRRTNAASNKQLNTGWICGIVGYFVAVFAYVIYSTETQTGLFGYLLALQMNAIGYASTTLTVLFGTLACMFLPLFVVALVWQMVVAIGRLVGVTGKVAPGPTGSAARTVPLTRPVARLLPVTWKRVFAITSLPLLAGLAIASVFLLLAKRQNQTVYAIDLGDREATVPKDAAFVELNAVLVRGYLTGYREDNNNLYSVHVYAPLAGPGWNPAEPIRYFVHHVTDTHFDSNGKADLPSAFGEHGMARFSGKLAGSLPVVVRQKYNSKGLKIAPGYVVIDWTDRPGGQQSTQDRYTLPVLIGLIGLVVALIFFTMLVANKVRGRSALGYPISQTGRRA